MKKTELREEIIRHIRCYQKNLTVKYLSELSDEALINNVHPSCEKFYGEKLIPCKYKK